MILLLKQRNSLLERFKAWVRTSPPVRNPDLGLISLGIFILLVGVGAVIPVRTIYAREHGSTMAELGMMASGFLLGQFLFQIPGGWLSDRWGRKPLLIAGIVVSGLVSFLFLANDNPWYFIALRFIEGAASGALVPAANAYVIDVVPPKERGAAFGWIGAANSAGFMMGPAIGGVVSDWYGYVAPFVFGGIASLATAALLMVKMTNTKPGSRTAEDDGAGEKPSETEGKNDRAVPKALFWPALIGILVIFVAAGFGDGLFISIWSLWLNDLHASNSYIGLTFVVFSLPLMVLMPITGKLADKHRLLPLIVIPGLLLSLVYFSYSVTTNLLVILLMGVFEGAMLAVSIPAIGAFTANLSPDNARGKLQGVISTTRTSAGFVSSMLVAILYGESMAFPFIMLSATQISLTLLGGALLWRVERKTRKLNERERKPVLLEAHTASGSARMGEAAR
jgi:DHA1 family multidrug resistance protein-like MFS transporter